MFGRWLRLGSGNGSSQRRDGRGRSSNSSDERAQADEEPGRKRTQPRTSRSAKGPTFRRRRTDPTPPDVQLPPLPEQSQVPHVTKEGLSLDRKLDMLGVVLVILALIAFLGYVSEPGTLTGALLSLLSQVFGWYSPAFIIIVGAVGLWLILRNFREQPARLEVFRTGGFVLLCVTVLTATHFIGMNFSPGVDSKDFVTAFWHAEKGAGGGYIGACLYKVLVEAIGVEGAGIVLLGALIVSVMLAFGLSLGELAVLLRDAAERVRHGRGAPASPPEGQPFPEIPSVVGAVEEYEALEGGRLVPALPEGEDATAPPGAQPTPTTALQDQRQAPASTLYGPPMMISSAQHWELPDHREVLDESGEQVIADEILVEQARIIEDTLHSFGAPGRVVEINPGPVITQFGVEPSYVTNRAGKKTKVKVGKIAALADDIALALAAKSVRVEAPAPGKGFVGIEVPNPETSLVSLRDIMEGAEFRKIKSKLRIGLGQSVDGKPMAADLTAMPHLLIAGTTGAGKSVCVNAIVACLLLQNTPADLRFIMVDPKRVELMTYNGIPHLVTPVVTDLDRIVGVLKWATREMDERYRKLAQAGARNIRGYNKKMRKAERLPYLLVVVDELADLMMLAPEETERIVTRMSQMARATGIHLIISTQRPSVDVVTGLIKANFPARIAFAVASSVDSRVILDMPGAERLLGRGDMLYQSPDASAPVRMQGVFVSDAELNRLVSFWKKANSASVAEKLSAGESAVTAQETPPPVRQSTRRAPEPGPNPASPAPSDDDDDLYEEAVAVVREMNKASASLLQRRLRIGYTRASRLIDLLEERGVIGPAETPSKPRRVMPVEKYKRTQNTESGIETTNL
jgi:S-DNA-T family DNA segregation ATPase FtsK/SpoIIIE